MLPGDVVRWHSFPFQENGPAKTRWFVCIGKITAFGQETKIFLSTTTTKLEYYIPGGKREKHPKFIFSKSADSIFPEDCLIDLKLSAPADYLESTLERYSDDINLVGSLPKKTMTELFNAIVRAGTVPKVILSSLRRSLEESGCVGLAKP